MPQKNGAAEVGTPIVDSTGDLAGMYMGANSATIPVASLAPFLSTILPQKADPAAISPVHEDWKNGMDAYYHQMNAAAHVDFQKAYAANANFQAAQQFFTLSGQSASGQTAGVQKAAVHQQTTPAPPGSVTINGVQFLYWQLAAFFVILIAIILLVLMIIWRARLRQRKRALDAELADAEQHASIDAQRIRVAELEASQGNMRGGLSSPLPAIAKTGPLGMLVHLCPNCSKVVAADARFCLNCQQQLIPDSSSIQRRGHSPLAPAYGNANGAVSPPASVANSIAEQPTVIPAGAIAEQPTIVPGRSIAEQPTVDIISGNELVVDEHHDREKTIPYAMRHLSGQRLGFVVGSRSDPGIKRKYKPNEDSLFVAQGVMKGSSRPPMFGLYGGTCEW
jgi:hypothetical protein